MIDFSKPASIVHFISLQQIQAMVSIQKENGKFIFEVKGLHKLWALKSQIEIPVEHIVSASKNTADWSGFIGIRLPGLQIPGVITAGTYLVDDGTIFCDVVHSEKCIVVELNDEQYKRLVIEVEDVDAALAILNG